MAEQKKLVVNCDVCDVRNIKEEVLAEYDRIVIKSDILLVNGRSREVLGRLPADCEVDTTLELEGEVKVSSYNGSFEIGGNTPMESDTLLCVNGSLYIRAGSEKIMDHYVKIIVNGEVLCPESMAPYMDRLSVNGIIKYFPDDCIVLKPEVTIDRYFHIRASKGARYYVKDKVVLTDPQADAAALVAKEVRFVTEKFVTAEAFVEQAAALTGEDTELVVVPQGMAYVENGATLDEALLQRYGASLYIDGNLQLDEASTPLLSRIERLHVAGSVRLLKKQQEEFYHLNAQYDKIQIVKGRWIGNKVYLVIDNAMLDASPEGISIGNCAVLRIKEEVDSRRILDMLDVGNCARVICGPQQRNAVELVCRNVATILDGGDAQEDGLPGKRGQEEGTKVIKGDYYVL